MKRDYEVSHCMGHGYVKEEKNDVIKLSLAPLSLVKTQFVTFYSHLCTKKMKDSLFLNSNTNSPQSQLLILKLVLTSQISISLNFPGSINQQDHLTKSWQSFEIKKAASKFHQRILMFWNDSTLDWYNRTPGPNKANIRS